MHWFHIFMLKKVAFHIRFWKFEEFWDKTDILNMALYKKCICESYLFIHMKVLLILTGSYMHWLSISVSKQAY